MAFPPKPDRPLSIDEAHAALTAPGMAMEVVEENRNGTTFKVWKNALPTVRALWESTARFRDAGWEFLVHLAPDGSETQRVSFAQAWTAVGTMGHTFLSPHASFGLKKGDRVAIMMRNRPEFILGFYGAVTSGMIAVPINGWLTAPEAHYCVDNADCRVLLVDQERFDRLTAGENVLASLQRKGLTVVLVPEGKPSEADRRKILQAGAVLWDDVVSGKFINGARSDLPDVQVLPEDLCTIMYTSGTTGRPKGAAGSHRNFTSCPFHNNVAPLRNYLRKGEAIPLPDPNAPQQTGICTLPLFHVGGLHGALQAYTMSGTRIITLNKFDAGVVVRAIEKYRVTGIGTVPTIVWAIIEHPEFATRDMSSLQAFTYGGSPASEELQRKIREKVKGSSAGQSFGMTETGSNNVTVYGEDFYRKPTSTGVPTPVNKVMIISDDDDKEFKPLPVNTVGEICIFGPNVVEGGYWRNPEATKKSFFAPGWYRTGDVGRIDEEGFLYIHDRIKDMLIRGVENVYTSIVENCLFKHPAVLEAAVVGIPHRRLGEEPAAVVQIRPEYVGKVTEAELRKFVASQIASFQVPVMIVTQTEELPYNQARKVLKRELRDELVRIAKERGILDGGAAKL